MLKIGWDFRSDFRQKNIVRSVLRVKGMECDGIKVNDWID